MRVSCLMITRPERHEMMADAVEAWTRQTHPERELIVVVDLGPSEVRAAAAATIERFRRNDIHVVTPAASHSLGALRNLAVARASGEVVCVWDDDDLHHPQRISRQLDAMTQAGCVATVLQEAMLYRPASRTLRGMNWAATPAGGLPGTLMCRRADMPRYPESGPESALGEDLDLLLRLRAEKPICLQTGEPHLYVYVTHAANSSGPEHHGRLAESLSISSGLLKRREAALREGLAPFAFQGVSVEGPNGPAFTL